MNSSGGQIKKKKPIFSGDNPDMQDERAYFGDEQDRYLSQASNVTAPEEAVYFSHQELPKEFGEISQEIKFASDVADGEEGEFEEVEDDDESDFDDSDEDEEFDDEDLLLDDDEVEDEDGYGYDPADDDDDDFGEFGEDDDDLI